MKTLAAMMFVLLSIVPAQAAELIMVNSRSCGYCASFNREVAPTYNATAAGRLAPLRKVSPLKKWPADLAGVAPTTFAPVFILVDDGREVGRIFGYPSESHFWGKLKPLLAKLG